jgi:uncharacterized membrane-anchored protein YitT (DUF2179 family)
MNEYQVIFAVVGGFISGFGAALVIFAGAITKGMRG